MKVADENNVVIESTVARPPSAQNPNAQAYAHIYINGTWVAADLDQASNRLWYTPKKLPNLAGNDVMVLVSENKKNRADGFHISTPTQTAVVPKTENPTVRFYWSAVLEDPNHSPAEQPYVEIVVENKTKGIVLYTKRFYSNDPSYSGWKSYRNDKWRSIPWQLVDLPVAQYAGDQLTIRVVAADCALGAHGGYAYLDVEE